MNNFSSFLDAPGPNMPRQAPTPTPSSSAAAAAAAAAAHQNGMGSAGGQPNGTVPLVNGLPSGGQQTDMNHLWQVVQQLSEQLAENRAQTMGIVNGVQAIHARASEEGGLQNLSQREVNGEMNGKPRVSRYFKDYSVAEWLRIESQKAKDGGDCSGGRLGERRSKRCQHHHLHPFAFPQPRLKSRRLYRQSKS